MNWVNLLFYFAIMWLFFSLFVIILGLIMFGKIINLQLKYWLLAKKGYHKVEHLGEDKVIRTFFLRPKDEHFEFDNGLYLTQKDAFFKSSKDVLKKIDPKLYKKGLEKEELTQEENEIKGLLKQIGKLKYSTDSVFLQFGIPTIFYYGNDLNPINPAERRKIYDSKVMMAYIKRLLLEKEWKFVKLVLTLTLIGFAVSLIIAVIYWTLLNKNVTALNSCIGMLNASQSTVNNYLNITGQALTQNSTIII